MLLLNYLKEQGCTTAALVKGDNGCFVAATKANGDKITLPVGKRSQDRKLHEYNVLITPEGVAIATVNSYETLDEVVL
jgi:hypothetical protein